jgi:phosphatidylglycerol:prolipoprotein diacylglycerol transferase
MSLAELTPQQRYEVTKGEYRCRPVHPTQLYSSANALLLCVVLYLLWRRSLGWPRVREQRGWSRRPGFTTAAFLVLYGVTRFLLELVRDDNPFEIAWLTISQILGLLLLAAGMIMLAALVLTKPSPIGQTHVIKKPEKPRSASRAAGSKPESDLC